MRTGFPLAVLLLLGVPAADGQETRPEPPPKPAPITGVVVASDGRTLPEYTIEMRITRSDPAAPGGTRTRLERVTTNAEGRFTSALPHLPGPVLLTRVDTDGTSLARSRGGLEALEPVVKDYRIEHAGKPLQVVVPCGPTYELAWAPPASGAEVANGPALGACTARLVARSPDGIDEGFACTTRLRVRDELHGWVRFARWPVDERDASAPVRLEVVTVDGRWISVVDLTDPAVRRGGSLHLAWQPSCRWIGRIPGQRGAPSERVWVTAERRDEHETLVERRRTWVEPDGRAAFRGLAPGSWRFATRSLRFLDWTSEWIVLAWEEPHSQPIPLVPIELGVRAECFVRGGAVGADRAPPAPARVWLARPGEILPLDELPLEFSAEDGEWRAPIVFERVPPGEYQLVVLPVEGAEAGMRLASQRVVTGSGCAGLDWR